MARRLHDRAPACRVVAVDYLTILPPEGHDVGTPPPAEIAEWGRAIATRLAATTRAGAEAAGWEYVAASAASADHHAWSVGFSLATGHVVVGETSDLDLLIRCQSRPAPGSLERAARVFAGQEARVDCQIETPNGIAHIDDLWRDGRSVLVRTADGARLCNDPWALIES